MNDERPTHIDLFSGIGGFALSAQWAGFRTVAFCEIDGYCQKVLAKNFVADTGCERDAVGREASNVVGEAGASQDYGEKRERLRNTTGDGCSIISNIFDFDGTAYRGCDLLTGGFPCQPFSVAGKRRGAADGRALWPEMFRVINEARPAWIIAENVPGFLTMEQFDVPLEMDAEGAAIGQLGTVVNRVGRGIADEAVEALESIGYAVAPFVIPACAVDARHRRDRLWIVGRFVGNTAVEGSLSGTLPGVCGREESARPRDEEPERRGCPISFANGSNGHRRRSTVQVGRVWNKSEAENNSFGAGIEWIPEPDVGGSTHGLPEGLDQAGLTNEAKTRATKILSDVRSETFTEAFQETIGRFHGVLESELLLAFLCEYESNCDQVRLALEERATTRRLMRSLWHQIESARSSYRRRYNQQFAQQYSDALRQLSREAPSLFSQAWQDDSWEDGTPRVAHKIPSRVDRLKGLGNAIVPQVAYEILREIRKLIT